jgi:hypothetical protein
MCNCNGRKRLILGPVPQLLVVSQAADGRFVTLWKLSPEIALQERAMDAGRQECRDKIAASNQPQIPSLNREYLLIQSVV